MPGFLESGKLQLTADEAGAYRSAARRLQEACEVALDLSQPISIEDWTLLHVAQAGLAGDLEPLDESSAPSKRRFAPGRIAIRRPTTTMKRERTCRMLAALFAQDCHRIVVERHTDRLARLRFVGVNPSA